ncbi:MAG: hypothetical protein WC824_08815 [Bacteroidota bacterium]|jgi:hypothetical protein
MKSQKTTQLDDMLDALLALPYICVRLQFKPTDRIDRLRFAERVLPCLTDDEIRSIYIKKGWSAEQIRTYFLGRIGIELAINSLKPSPKAKREIVEISRDVTDEEIHEITQLLIDAYVNDRNIPVKQLCELAAGAGRNLDVMRVKYVLHEHILPSGVHPGCKEMQRTHRGEIRRFYKTKQYLQFLLEREGWESSAKS